MKKFIKYIFTGVLGEEWAGSRPLTRNERYSLLAGIYTLTGMVMYYQWKEDAIREEDFNIQESLSNRVDILREENQRLIAEKGVLGTIQYRAIKKYDAARLPYTFPHISKFYETELTEGERAAFQNDKNRFRDALTGVDQN